MSQGTESIVTIPNQSAPVVTTPTSTPMPKEIGGPMPKEIGGPSGPEPTRYGDWEHKGRCSDF